MALVTHQGPGHRSPAPPAAHLLQLEVASQSLKPVDAVAIYALWRREGNWGYAPCRNSPLAPKRGGGLGSVDSPSGERIALSGIR